MKHAHTETPYLEVVDEPRMMAGKGAPRSTVFGVLGRTKESGGMKTLGGLVRHPASEKIVKGTLMKHHAPTERHCCGPAPKTHISGQHYGQIPYPGAYMAPLGHRL